MSAVGLKWKRERNGSSSHAAERPSAVFRPHPNEKEGGEEGNPGPASTQENGVNREKKNAHDRTQQAHASRPGSTTRSGKTDARTSVNERERA